MEKSRQDEYFLSVIVGSEGVNVVGREHYRRQVRGNMNGTTPSCCGSRAGPSTLAKS